MLIDRLAWYASDRGDAATAIRLWRQLPATNVITADIASLEHYAGGGRHGRNEACWCGSGRKYKHCHLDTIQLAPLSERVGWLCRKAVSYLERRGGTAQDDVFEIAVARAVDPDDRTSIAAALSDPIVMDLVLHEGGWFATFLTERGPLLPADEAFLGASWQLVDRTVYEIDRVEPGVGLTVRDLRTGDQVDVTEQTFSREARTGGLVCARAVSDGTGHQFIGGLFPVAPGTERHVLGLLDARDPVEIAAHVAALHRPPVLVTREHEPLLDCQLAFHTDDVDALRAFLDVNYEAVSDGWAETHDLGAGEQIMRAHLHLDGDQLTVTTSSAARADRVRATITGGRPDVTVVADRRRPFDLANMPIPAGYSDHDVPVEALDQIREQIEDRWCDEPVPALHGLTPRQAAADPTAREGLIRLIDSFEHADIPDAISQRPPRLRQLLDPDP